MVSLLYFHRKYIHRLYSDTPRQVRAPLHVDFHPYWAANPELAAEWLRLAGCKKIFFTSAYTGEGIAEILSYLKEPVDVLPWEVAKAEYDKLGFGPGESEKHTLRI